MKTRYLFLGALLALIALVLVACQPAPGPSQPTEAAQTNNTAQANNTPQANNPPQAACPTAAPCPTSEAPVVDVPFIEAWQSSPHADAGAEAFVHWNEEDPKEIPASCAKCHSTPGYLDFLGEDGTAFGEVNNPAPVGTTVECAACHNATAATLSAVTFPSGAVIEGAGPASRCVECHQGRASKASVDQALADLNLTEDVDTVNADLPFVNIHYYAAAATLYGSEAHGGYEYDGLPYTLRFEHVDGYNTCVGCHNPHTLEVKVDQCAACHDGVASVEDIRNVRMQASSLDYDGDGDLEEGISGEIQTLQENLLQSIKTYSSEVVGTPAVYDAATYPYFFVDTNANGELDEGEAAFNNAYKAFTGRMLKAAYNYQTSIKDPGAYAHNAKYIIQLLHDSIADLNGEISTPVDLANAHRDDPGHFNSSEEAFRHWDEDGVVDAACMKCHNAAGLPMFVANAGSTIAQPPTNNLYCTTCHTNLEDFTLMTVEEVRFPSGAVLAFPNAPESNICLMCHQGRESGVSIQTAIDRAGVGPNEPSEALRFRNPHYFAAGATLFGSEANGAYEFEGQEYNGRFLHVQPFDACAECHDAHGLNVQVQLCSNCHGDMATQEDLRTIRLDVVGAPVDYDGDGDTTEGIAGEIQTMHEALYAALQAYASNTTGLQPIAFDPAAYPYWFNDANANGKADQGEEQYGTWTPTLLRGAYNYTWVAKDPGAFAHNNEYVLQFLYDSIAALGGDVSGMTRPAVRAQAGFPTPAP